MTAVTFQVVFNAEGRHSLWPADRPLPAGWSAARYRGPRDRCLDYLRHNWTPVELSDPQTRPGRLKLGLMFFGDREQDPSGDKYDLLLRCARFADANGLASIWLPERHFTRFGCLYPSPATLHAALARETSRIGLRAGSVVMPLHDPVRVAEEWAVVDNLSRGRVGLSFASGWHPDDFALAPDTYQDRHQRMYDGIEQVQALWRGEAIHRTNGAGESVEVRTHPRPVQSELPIWITAASRAATFEQAGRRGANLLTHLFDQQMDDLAEKIEAYRRAREQHGFDPRGGQVTVALHTFVAPSLDEVRRCAHRPYCSYLKSNLKLLGSLALSRGQQIDISTLAPQERDDMLDWVFDKFLGKRSFLGTVDSCWQLAAELAGIGVTEIACLLDFGPEKDAIIEHMPLLADLNQRLATPTAMAAPRGP